MREEKNKESEFIRILKVLYRITIYLFNGQEL